jgi:ribosomal protein L30/L7E
MTPKTIDECYRKLGLTHRPTHLEMVTTAKLREMIRKTWNFAVAAEREKQKETT